MKIDGNTDQIRQSALGQFRSPEDGERPYVHVKDQRVDGAAVYANDQNTGALESGMELNKESLFDTDAGMKLDLEKSKVKDQEEDTTPQYNETGNTQNASNKGLTIDQLI